MYSINKEISSLLNLSTKQVDATLSLLQDGATIPFIARYRKEKTGTLDEVQISQVRDQFDKLTEFQKRKTLILDSLSEREILTPTLNHQLEKAKNLVELEDIYLPFKIKRKTRAVTAKEKGLAPVASAILNHQAITPQHFINNEKGVHAAADVINGAKDIIAEIISEDSQNRSSLRNIFFNYAQISAKAKKGAVKEESKFADYFDFSFIAKQLPGHRLLAILRGEKEEILKVSLRPDEDRCLSFLYRKYLKNNSPNRTILTEAIQDCYKRLLCPSLETELRNSLTEKAEKEAIVIFATNLQQLLLASPLGQVATLGIDPGFRTGAKIASLDKNGKYLDSATIYPTHNTKMINEAGTIVLNLIKTYKTKAIAIGNGTASRETELFIRNLQLHPDIIVAIVNEDGASVYSASENARNEFPKLDITIRGAISIGRRLQDPLAELVKIDPKSIGVGQYQHDVNQTALKAKLTEVISSCVNKVGVDLNSASFELLTQVSGLGAVLAKNIIEYRNENGSFSTRAELLKVPRLGKKAYEQCAGFLRIRKGSNPLDNTGVHPENYSIVKNMASDLNVSIDKLIENKSLTTLIDISKYISNDVGEPTLNDIVDELNKPGRDPREKFTQFNFSDSIQTIDDLEEDMILPAIITNITKFGAFADLGIHNDGLIHISQLADKFVKDPHQVVHLNQQVKARVVSIDKKRKRIGLSLKGI